MLELMVSWVMVLAATSIFMITIAVAEIAFLWMDKLVILIRRHNEKAPRTLTCSREQETKSNKSVA